MRELSRQSSELSETLLDRWEEFIGEIRETCNTTLTPKRFNEGLGIRNKILENIESFSKDQKKRLALLDKEFKKLCSEVSPFREDFLKEEGLTASDLLKDPPAVEDWWSFLVPPRLAEYERLYREFQEIRQRYFFLRQLDTPFPFRSVESFLTFHKEESKRLEKRFRMFLDKLSEHTSELSLFSGEELKKILFLKKILLDNDPKYPLDELKQLLEKDPEYLLEEWKNFINNVKEAGEHLTLEEFDNKLSVRNKIREKESAFSENQKKKLAELDKEFKKLCSWIRPSRKGFLKRKGVILSDLLSDQPIVKDWWNYLLPRKLAEREQQQIEFDNVKKKLRAEFVEIRRLYALEKEESEDLKERFRLFLREYRLFVIRNLCYLRERPDDEILGPEELKEVHVMIDDLLEDDPDYLLDCWELFIEEVRKADETMLTGEEFDDSISIRTDIMEKLDSLNEEQKKRLALLDKEFKKLCTDRPLFSKKDLSEFEKKYPKTRYWWMYLEPKKLPKSW